MNRVCYSDKNVQKVDRQKKSIKQPRTLPNDRPTLCFRQTSTRY